MNQFLVAIAIAIIPFISSAQKNLLIQGKVIQKSNSEAIQWASISIKNRPLGTVSGKDGSFEFHFSADYTNDEFMISHIGFKTYTIKVKDAVAMGNTIYYLEEDSVNLPEIHVLAKQLTAHQIIKKAISAVQKNYPTTPFALDAFYRDYKKVNGEYVSLLEAAVSIYDPGYARKSGSEQVTVDEIRRSKRYINEYEGFVSQLNLLKSLLGLNDVKHRRNRALGQPEPNYILDETTILDNEFVYVISTNGIKKFKIYIRASNYAILRIEQDTDYRNINHVNNYKANDSVFFKITSIQSYLDFKPYNNKLYLNYMNYSWTTENINTKTNKVINTTYFYQELMPNLIMTDNVQPPPPNTLMADTTLEIQTKKYNSAFWAQYNMVTQNPADEQILQDLSKDVSTPFEKTDAANLPKSKKKKRSN